MIKKILYTVLFLFNLSIGFGQTGQKSSTPLPFNAPCTDCEEILEKRTATSREFVDSEHIYLQQSLGDINFLNEKGNWVAIDPHLTEQSKNVFTALQQPAKIVVDFNNRYTSITNGNFKFIFNKNIELVHIDEQGNSQPLGVPYYSDVAIEQGSYNTTLTVTNFYPGINLQIITTQGAVETNFILSHQLPFKSGNLVIRQRIDVPDALTFTNEGNGDNGNLGMIKLQDSQGNNVFWMPSSYAYDANGGEGAIQMPWKVYNNYLNHYVSVSWLNEPSRSYPVTLDPIMRSSGTVFRSAIAGSGYVATCGSGGCLYTMNVNTPPNVTIDSIRNDFVYEALLPCSTNQGGFRIILTTSAGACSTPGYSSGTTNGIASFSPFQVKAPLNACILPPQCASYNMNFTLDFYRCTFPTAGCDSTCIHAVSAWMMTIVGRTIENKNISSPVQICEGASATLADTMTGGVGPYVYVWQPGGLTGSRVSVSPAVTTPYTVTATDACGITATASTTVNVIANQNPDFTIAPNDTVCEGATIMLTGNGTGPMTSYDWVLNCPTNASFNDQQSLTYPAPSPPASCTATLNFEVTQAGVTCTFTKTQTITVIPASGGASVNITANPS